MSFYVIISILNLDLLCVVTHQGLVVTTELVLTPEAHSAVLAIKTILEGYVSLKKDALLIYA